MGDCLSGKIAIVTGAGSGIGAASAMRFAAEGARVLAADIRGHKAEQTVADIEDQGGQAVPLSVDVADPESVASMITFCLDCVL